MISNRKSIIGLITSVILTACGGQPYEANELAMKEVVDANALLSSSELSTQTSDIREEQLGKSTEFSQKDRDDYTKNRKVIRNAGLEFETDSLLKTRSEIIKAMQMVNGFLYSENQFKNEYKVSNEMVLKVPNSAFDSLIGHIEAKAIEVDFKDITTEDVTSKYVDIQARLNTKKILEKRYIAMLSKTSDIDDMLRIERQISSIREDIESTESVLRTLKDQVTFSTIRLKFYVLKEIEKKSTSVQALYSGWTWFYALLVGLITVWPLWIILGAGFWILKRNLRLKRKKALQK